MIIPARRGIKMATLTTALLLAVFTVSLFAHEWMAPKEAAEMKNPVAPTRESLQKGAEAFAANCAGCHGDDAEGPPPDATGLSTPIPDLKKNLKSHSDGDFFWKIQNGKGEMPSFKNALDDADIWRIINYIKSMI